MAIGPLVRSWFGPLEGPITDLYRAFFIDLTCLARRVKKCVPEAKNVLEIGCGEGALCERLAAAYPTARVTGIDVSPRAGRLFRGDRDRVTFACATAAAFAAEGPKQFDLVLMCDVLHHVPWDQHVALLRDAESLLRPGGAMVVKEWELLPNIGQMMAEFGDRILTGDDVRFGTTGYFRDLLTSVFGAESVQTETRVRPWRNNLMFIVRRDGTFHS